MYLEQLTIFLYRRDYSNWKQLSEEEQWYYEEPEKPQILLEEEALQEEVEREIIAPDILGG
jgi:hypothetical protein